MQATEPITARAVEAHDATLVIVLADRRVEIPWGVCSLRLRSASPAERKHMELSPGGYGIHWPLIDEDLSVGGLLRDHEVRKSK